MSRPTSVSNWQPSKPTKRNEALMEPNAKDNPDSLTPDSPYKQAIGRGGAPKGPLGKKGREY